MIGVVTAIYALLTYEILLQNQAMAKAATDSTRVMEQSLRFSYAPNLLYRTISTRNPDIKAREGFTPYDNEDYQRAMAEYGGGEQQKEFVFAVVQNVGRGSATSLTIEAQYNIWDTGNPNSNYSVHRTASIPILESNKAVALCVYVSKVPTADDRVEIVSAAVTSSDFYRDALREAPVKLNVRPGTHHVVPDPGCVVRLV